MPHTDQMRETLAGGSGLVSKADTTRLLDLGGGSIRITREDENKNGLHFLQLNKCTSEVYKTA